MIIRISHGTIQVGGRPFLLCEGLTFTPGRVHCIQGRSGTGKSSFLRAIAGANSPSLTGTPFEYVLGNSEVGSLKTKKLELGVQVCVLQQSAPLWPHLSAFANTWLPWASQHGVRETIHRRDSARQSAQYWLSKLGLNESIWRRRPFSLSGGERQRVALAAVLVFDCPFLLLDEPTANLDRKSTTVVSEILEQEANKGKLIIVTSHDVDFLSNELWHHLVIVEQNSIEPRFRICEVS